MPYPNCKPQALQRGDGIRHPAFVDECARAVTFARHREVFAACG
jgi:hypothetical protein